MHVHGPSHVHGPHGVNAPHNPQLKQPSAPGATTRAAEDQLDISPAAEAAIRAHEGGEVRQDLVARLRREIASGTYETPDKVDQAVERLLDDIV